LPALVLHRIIFVLTVLFQWESKNTTLVRLLGHRHATDCGGGGVEVDVNSTRIFLRFENNSIFLILCWLEAQFSIDKNLT
jgi:hypothetical protein